MLYIYLYIYIIYITYIYIYYIYIYIYIYTLKIARHCKKIISEAIVKVFLKISKLIPTKFCFSISL